MTLDYTETIAKMDQANLRKFASERVDLKGNKADLLVYRYQPKDKPVARVLITAGFDGDEYDGIEAAMKLPGLIEKMLPAVAVTVLPIANPFGFAAGTSEIPADQSFPKAYFPGLRTGNMAERLVWNMAPYFAEIDYWLDLHGGNQYESLYPFCSGYLSGEETVDRKVRFLLSGLAGDEVVWQAYHGWRKIVNLAERGIAYLLLEAGEMGKASAVGTKLQIERVIKLLKLVSDRIVGEMGSPPLSAMDRYDIPWGCKWEPKVSAGEMVVRGQMIGRYKFGGVIGKVVTARNGGRLLWMRQAGFMKVLEPVAEINYRI